MDRWGDHAVREAEVRLGGTTATANIYGSASFTFEGAAVPSGTVGLTLVARADESRPPCSGAADPDLLAGVGYGNQPSRMYRRVFARVTITDGLFDATGPNEILIGNRYAAIYRVSPCLLEIDWRPDFIQSPGQGARTRGIDLVVLHHTGGSGLWIGPTISTFGGDTPDSAQDTSRKSIHYIVDTDGFVVKMMPDEAKAFHAGEGADSRWRGFDSVGESSIGIEIVHDDGSAEFTEAQYRSLIHLLGQLVQRHSGTGLTRKRIVYHSDVRMDGSGRYVNGNKKGCPSVGLHWRRFIDAGFGPSPSWNSAHLYVVQGVYHGFFDDPRARLVRGDDDSIPRYGGAASALAGAGLVATLQRRLAHIGYSINEAVAGQIGPGFVNGQEIHGVYDRAVASSLDSFRIHYMGQSHPDHENTPFDRATALALEAVYLDV